MEGEKIDQLLNMFVWLLFEERCRPDITVLVDWAVKNNNKKLLLKHVAIKTKVF